MVINKWATSVYHTTVLFVCMVACFSCKSSTLGSINLPFSHGLYARIGPIFNSYELIHPPNISAGLSLSLCPYIFSPSVISCFPSHHSVCLSLSGLVWISPADSLFFGLSNMPWLAHTKSDCTVTSHAPELADWLTMGAEAGEWKRGGGYTRREAAEGLMGIGETEWRCSVPTGPLCCSHFEFLSSSRSTRLQLLTWWKLQHSNNPLLT